MILGLVLTFLSKAFVFLFLLLGSYQGRVYAQWQEVEKSLSTKPTLEMEDLRALFLVALNQGYYYSALPFIKEYFYLSKLPLGDELDLKVDELISYVGVEQLETLPAQVLKKSGASSVKYILGHKKFLNKKYDEAINYLIDVDRRHPVYAHAHFLLGSIYSLKDDYRQAQKHYKTCTRNIPLKKRQDSLTLEKRTLRDYCRIALARDAYAQEKFNLAEERYNDLEKSSYIWPEILFEKAWVSFRQQDYNKTLGRLIAYDTQLLDFVFNPEVEMLRIFAFYKLCFWADIEREAKKFLTYYSMGSDDILKFVKKYKKSYRHYFKIIKEKKMTYSTSPVLNKAFKSIRKNIAVKTLMANFQEGVLEAQKVKGIFAAPKTRKLLYGNVIKSLVHQREIIGAHVLKNLMQIHMLLQSNLKLIRSMRLESLSVQKQNLLSGESGKNIHRGKIKRDRAKLNQYFWGFNGEFWAEEFGDYIFRFDSACPR